MGSRAIVLCVVLFLAGSVAQAVSTQDSPAPGAAPERARTETERARFAGRFADRKLMRANCRAGAESAVLIVATGAEERPAVAFGEHAALEQLEHLVRKIQQADEIRDCGTTSADPPSDVLFADA